jgi:hypothetical protein
MSPVRANRPLKLQFCTVDMVLFTEVKKRFLTMRLLLKVLLWALRTKSQSKAKIAPTPKEIQRTEGNSCHLFPTTSPRPILTTHTLR